MRDYLVFLYAASLSIINILMQENTESAMVGWALGLFFGVAFVPAMTRFLDSIHKPKVQTGVTS